MAITTYTDFVNNYLTKNGMIGNAANINKAPDQLKLEIDELNSTKADKLGKLSQFASTTSAELAGVISDETGSGKVVFSVSPALTGTPTAPTAAVGTNTTQLATTAFVLANAGNTNLTTSTSSTTLTVNSSTGTNATLPAATTTVAGVMTGADKTKLDGIASGAQVNVATNLGITAGTTAGPIVTSSTGTNATLPTASASASGVVTTGYQTWAGVKTFSSSPIVPTPTTGTQAVNKDYADLKVALTNFTGANQNIDGTGYQKLPGGLIIQWGANIVTVSGETGQVFNLPITFPNAFLRSIAGNGAAGGISGTAGGSSEESKSQIRLYSTGTQLTIRWIAIGY